MIRILLLLRRNLYLAMLGEYRWLNQLPETRGNSICFNFDNSFASSLEDFFVSCHAEPAIAPKLLQFNHALAKDLGLDPVALDSEAGLAIFSGNLIPEGSHTLAQAYAGHQFGGFSPQLGDGRALLLGEVIDTQNRRRDIQLKGSGRTPFCSLELARPLLIPVLLRPTNDCRKACTLLGHPDIHAPFELPLRHCGRHDGSRCYHRGGCLSRNPLPGAILTRVAC